VCGVCVYVCGVCVWCVCVCVHLERRLANCTNPHMTEGELQKF